jgi:RNA-binding protein YlmH
MYGDIVRKDNNAYIYMLPSIKYYILYNFKDYNRKIQDIEEIDIESLNDYEINYEEKEIIVSSLRIDNVISNLLGFSRKELTDKFKDKEVILNYEVITKYTTNLKGGDIFSVRRFGKFKFESIKKETKKGGLVIVIKKYK